MTTFESTTNVALRNQVNIIHFENSALFWIKNINCEDPLVNFEASQAKPSELNDGAYVAVAKYTGDNMKWSRGVIKTIYRTDVIRYRIFLIDEGKFVKSCNVVALDEKYTREPPQANLVALYCVLNKVENSGERSTCLGKIKSIANRTDLLFFQYVTRKNGIDFGHLWVYSDDNKYYKLQDIIRRECPHSLQNMLQDEFTRIVDSVALEYQHATEAITLQSCYAGENSKGTGLVSSSKISLLRIGVEFLYDGVQRNQEFDYFENCCKTDDLANVNHEAECKSTFELETNARFSNTLLHSNVNPTKECIKYVTVLEAVELNVLNDELATKLVSQELSTCQLYAFSAIFSGNNCALISGADLEVRRYGYLIPLANTFLKFNPREKDDYGNILSPIAIILCPYAADCQAVARVLSNLLNCEIEILIIYDYSANLRNTAGKNVILVSTPQFFIRTYKTNKRFKFTNTQYLIFDSTDILYEKHAQDIDTILIERANSVSDREKIQLIFSSQTWFPRLKYIVTRQLIRAIVTIAPSALMEAAIYGCSKFTLLHGLSKSIKVSRLLQFLKKHPPKPTAILCCDDDELNELTKMDVGSRIIVLVRDDDRRRNANTHEGTQLAENYSRLVKERKNPILICTDADLTFVRVENAQLLIHFTVPQSIELFSYRFSTLLSNYNSIFSKNHVDTHVFTLLGNDEILNKVGILENIYNWMKRTSSKGSESGMREIERKLEILRFSKERNSALCANICQFGKCSEKMCERRHFLSKEKDIPVDYLRMGKIKMKIADVYSASHFAVKMLEILENGNWRKFDSVHSYSKISSFAENPNNLKLAANPRKNDVVVVQLKDHYTRAIIFNIVENKVAVKLVDEGGFEDVTVNDLYEIPHELKILPHGVVDLYLFGASPLDNGVTWDTEATNWVKSKLKSYKFFTAKIFLTLGTRIWSDSLDCKNENGVTLLRIPSSLIAQNLALKNTHFWPFLNELCSKASMQNYVLNETAVVAVGKTIDDFDKSYEISESASPELGLAFDDSGKSSNSSGLVKSKGDSFPDSGSRSNAPTSISSDDDAGYLSENLNGEMEYFELAKEGFSASDDDSSTDGILSFLNEHSPDPAYQYCISKMMAVREQKKLAKKNNGIGDPEKIEKEKKKCEKGRIEGEKKAIGDEKLKNASAVDAPLESTCEDDTCRPKRIREYLDDFNGRVKDHIPNVKWYQSFDYIFVKIMIKNCAEDRTSLRITCANFIFETVVDNKRYLVNATPLFGAIVTSDCAVKFNREHVLIKMKKLIHFDWLRLIRGLQDRPWLCKDLENDCAGIVPPSISRFDGSRKLLYSKGNDIISGESWTGRTMDNWVSSNPGLSSFQFADLGQSSFQSESDSEYDEIMEDHVSHYT